MPVLLVLFGIFAEQHGDQHPVQNPWPTEWPYRPHSIAKGQLHINDDDDGPKATDNTLRRWTLAAEMAEDSEK